MKKLLSIVVLACIFLGGTVVFAQNGSARGDSDFYYVNVSLEKIWPYRKGYIVQYRKGMYQLARAYIPSEWFAAPMGRGEERVLPKGEIVMLPRGNAWPSMSVFYKDGEFSHVRLYIHKLHSHQSWGVVPQRLNLDDSFENIEDIRLQF